MVTLAVMLATIYLLARIFPSIGMTVSTIELVGLAFFTLIVSTVSFGFVPGFLTPVFVLHIVLFLSLTLFTLFYKLKHAQLVYIPQIKMMLIGLVLSLALSFAVIFIFVVVLQNPPFMILGPPCTLLFSGCIAYALARHRFLDVTSFVARVVSNTFVFASVILLEVALLRLGTTFLPANIDASTIAFAGSILIMLSYPQLATFITNLTDKIFFQGRYDTATLLQSLTQIMASEMNLEFLKLKLIKTLSAQMKLSSASLLLVSDFVAKKVPSLTELTPAQVKFSLLEQKIHTIKKPMIFEELVDEADKEIFRKLAISLIMPLFVGDEDIGLLILGPKLSRDIYVDRDIKVLEAFAKDAAIALKNADSYRQIQEFNQTLAIKVIARTHELEESQAKELKLKDEFVFIATHDLATPVTAIAGFSALIKAQKVTLPSVIERDLHAIDEASGRLQILVNDLLQVARSDSGTIKVELSPIDASQLISTAVSEVMPAAKDKNINVTLNLGPQNTVQADARKLLEVFENLLSNAVKYNKPNGAVTITSASSAGKITFTIKDTGIGINADEHKQVFTKFFRSENAEVRQRPGTGLGLFVARMLTEKMGGKISFESIENQGTTFTLEFNQ